MDNVREDLKEKTIENYQLGSDQTQKRSLDESNCESLIVGYAVGGEKEEAEDLQSLYDHAAKLQRCTKIGKS